MGEAGFVLCVVWKLRTAKVIKRYRASFLFKAFAFNKGSVLETCPQGCKFDLLLTAASRRRGREL